MKKQLAILSIALLLSCAAALAAQESDAEPLFNLDAIKKALPIQFRAYGKAIWAPMVYRGDMDGEISASHGEGPGVGVGAGPGWDGTLGAGLGIETWGSDKMENIGFNLRMRARAGDGDIYAYDNMAYLWARPFAGEVLKVQFGMYRWDELRGKVGGIGEIVGGYGGDEDSIFQRLESDTFGAMFIFTPPSIVPKALKGLMLFSSFGVSGSFEPSDKGFAASAEKALNYVFATPHAGIAWQHETFGLARLQFIASNYRWGDGLDWWQGTASTNVLSPVTVGKFYYPSHAREAARLELAVNVTSIPNLNLDLGFGLPLRVTVLVDDNLNVKPLGPTYREMGYRITDATATERIASDEGDIWQPPLRIAAGLDYKLPAFNFGFRFRTKMEFGETVVFYDGSDNFKGGFDLELGLDTSYTLGSIGVVSLNVALRANQNDSFNGNTKLGTNTTTAIESLNHNSVTDLGLGIFFTRQISKGNYIKAGVSATLPLSGDRYNWTPNGNDSELKEREAFRNGNLIVVIPIIIEMNLF